MWKEIGHSSQRQYASFFHIGEQFLEVTINY